MRNSARILVDDYEKFRHYLRRKLQSRECQIIGEAADGVQAVQAAEELQPDLVLIDIGMPKLNGIEAAHQISRLVSETKSLFVSQENDPDVVAEALSNGAQGYVQKQNAEKELLLAIETVLQGGRFVSEGLRSIDRSTSSAKPPCRYGQSYMGHPLMVRSLPSAMPSQLQKS
jgi:DNA-binding NarL/FixJ family response regulator